MASIRESLRVYTADRCGQIRRTRRLPHSLGRRVVLRNKCLLIALANAITGVR